MGIDILKQAALIIGQK